MRIAHRPIRLGRCAMRTFVTLGQKNHKDAYHTSTDSTQVAVRISLGQKRHKMRIAHRPNPIIVANKTFALSHLGRRWYEKRR